MPGDPQVTIGDLKRYAVARSLCASTTLAAAVERLGFIQADPIRAPARAQDLILRQRVAGYRAGDLERHYPELPVEEDFFINYGFVSRDVHALLHPRTKGVARGAGQRKRTAELLAFIRERGTVHPRDVDRHFGHGSVTNYWGGSSSATTHLLNDMHYQGLLRISARENGIRLYAARESPPGQVTTARLSRAASQAAIHASLDAIVDVAVALYAPVPSPTLNWLVNRLRHGTPQWSTHLKGALTRARGRLAHARLGAVDWYWPANETIAPSPAPDAMTGSMAGRRTVRLLAPFDPVVWDRRRFEHFWGWAYRFEAYTPARQRKLGYYALPMLWGVDVIGWANLAVRNGALVHDLGFASARATDRAFRAALADELERTRAFLGIATSPADGREETFRAGPGIRQAPLKPGRPGPI